MKILTVTPYYPPHWGGMEIIASKVVCGMRERRHKVKIVTTCESDCRQSGESDPDLYRTKINFKVFNTPISAEAYRLITALSQDVDLIHAYGYPVFFSDLAAHAASTKVPFILEWVIDPREAPAYRDSFLAKAATTMYMSFYGNKVFKRADAIIALSESHRKYLVSVGVPNRKIEVIPCGVDIKLFNPEVLPADLKGNFDYVVLYVGRISNQKGLDILLKAFPDVLKEHPNTLLAIIGLCDQPAYWRRIQQYICKLKNHVKFFESMPQDQLAKYYRAADLVVFPSRCESFGMVPVEASACGIPVVSTFAGAVEDLTKRVAFLVENESSPRLAESINYLLYSEDVRKKLGKKGVELVSQQYWWEAAFEKYEAAYKKAILSFN